MRVYLIPLILWVVSTVSVESRPQPLPQEDKLATTLVPNVPKGDGQGDNGTSPDSGDVAASNSTSEGTENPDVGPTGDSTEPSSEPTNETPGPSTGASTEPPTEEPTSGPTDNSTEPPTYEPTNEPTDEPTSEVPSNPTSTSTEYSTVTAAPSHHDKRSFDGWSFFGGILLTMGVVTVAIVALKYYKARTGGGSIGYNRF